MLGKLNSMWIYALTALTVVWLFMRNSKKPKNSSTDQRNFPTTSGTNPPPATNSVVKGVLVKQMYKDRFPSFYAQLDWYLGRYSPLKDFVFAQAMLESAQFSSNVYKNTNNPFGMGIPSRRPSKRIGEFMQFSKYKDDAQAIEDFREYLIYFNYPTTMQNVEQYVNTLAMKNYFEAPVSTYLIGMKKFFE